MLRSSLAISVSRHGSPEWQLRAAVCCIDLTLRERSIACRMLWSVTFGCVSENQFVLTSNVTKGTNDGITTIAVHSRMPGSRRREARSRVVDDVPQRVSVSVARLPRVGGGWMRG